MKKRIVFLDRDGVISEEIGNGRYIAEWNQFRFIPGALKAIRFLTEFSFDIFIVSNQGGVGKGLVTDEQLEEVTFRMLGEIGKNGGKVEGVFYCVHHPDYRCRCRKPGVALFKRAARGRAVEWERSFVVGDALRDIEAGRRLKCRTILVLSGRTRKNEVAAWPCQPDHITDSLITAVPWILEKVR
ncbi:MAG: HAD family hydrolase [Candidatus Omnitrophica bacterium]|nr:HAD family hydrolase [Candidatus Omnitrophota bacterium]